MSTATLTDSPTLSMRAFSYLRVSSPSQAKTDYLKDGLSIEVQRGGAEDKAGQLNASIEDEFRDAGKSAALLIFDEAVEPARAALRPR